MWWALSLLTSTGFKRIEAYMTSSQTSSCPEPNWFLSIDLFFAFKHIVPCTE